MTTLIHPVTTTPVETGFDAAFRRLVLAFEEYEELRRVGASFGALIEARAALQRARVDAAHARRS